MTGTTPLAGPSALRATAVRRTHLLVQIRDLVDGELAGEAR